MARQTSETLRLSTWSLVWAAIVVLGAGVGGLLLVQGAMVIGWAWIGAAGGAQFAWLCFGLWRWRRRPGGKTLAAVILASHAVGLIAAICWLAGWTVTAWAIVGIGAMALTLWLGIKGLKLLLWPRIPAFGVARTLIDEAVRMKVALIFVLMIVVFVPLMPLLLDPDERLTYRVQTFLDASVWLSSAMLSLMIIFLACGTICNEMKHQQVFMTLTKPIGRGGYLFGKWLGLTLISGVLVIVTGLGIYVFAHLLAQMPARDVTDRIGVSQEVLVARVATHPRPADGWLGLMEAELDQRPEWKELYGSVERLPEANRSDLASQVRQQFLTVAPSSSRTFVFDGLEPVRRVSNSEADGQGGTNQQQASGDGARGAEGAAEGEDAAASRRADPTLMQLRFQPKSTQRTPDGKVPLQFRINGRPYVADRFVEEVVQRLPIDPAWVDDQGRLAVSVRNPVPSSQASASVRFETGDGMMLLYTAGSFEANVIKAMSLLWMRLAFLAMLGLAAGTFLGFPVASLLTLLVYGGASFSGYVSEALEYYISTGGGDTAWQVIQGTFGAFWTHLTAGEIWSAIKVAAKVMASFFIWVIPSFTDYDGRFQLANGLIVPASVVGDALLKMGVISIAAVGAVGLLIFRKRELAQVMV